MPQAETTLTTPRRNFLVGALTAGASLAMPVNVQAETDPIFAAIDAHKKASKAVGVACAE